MGGESKTDDEKARELYIALMPMFAKPQVIAQIATALAAARRDGEEAERKRIADGIVALVNRGDFFDWYESAHPEGVDIFLRHLAMSIESGSFARGENGGGDG